MFNRYWTQDNSNMKYYSLSASPEPKIIGVNNGVYQGIIKWKYFTNSGSEKQILDYFSIKKHISNQATIDPIDFEIEYVEALQSAKMTDFFRFSPALYGVSFFVSKKAMNVLTEFNLPLSTFIPVQIIHRDIYYEYYAFYVAVHYREDAVDFSKSIFYEGTKFSLAPRKYLAIKNVTDYKQHKGSISSEKLAYNKKFNFSLDLFDTLFGKVDYYISERLKTAIEQAGLTGVIIKQPEEPVLIL